ncbi:MAG: transketolase [Planctomycetes bacterium]|nr:transketolase [Planctomycetota bacterium]
MEPGGTSIDLLSVNALRCLAIDAIERAQSGHPGLPLGAAPMAYCLWQRALRFDPTQPSWPDRDRFVLSAGHGSALLYSLLHLAGFDLPLAELQRFRQWGSKTPGHPEAGLTPGVEATTGPLGQGTANSVGMALAERWRAARYNRPGHVIVDHHTWALVSDGDLMEGISHEAASLAGHLCLGKLHWLYDANDITLDGPAPLSFSEDIEQRFEGYGWKVLHVEDGDRDLDSLDRAILAAHAETKRPTLIIVHTTIGFGSPKKAGSAKAHGAPLGAEEALATKQALGWPHIGESFCVPDAVRAHFAVAAERGKGERRRWEARFAAWAAEFPELADEWRAAEKQMLPANLEMALPSFEPGKELATRVAGGQVLNALAAKVPWLLGGDADLSESTKTRLSKDEDFDAQGRVGRNLHFGVREHAMGGILNGMCWHGGVRPFGSTFFVFADYMRPSVRLAALNHLPALYVWTHDSIAVGEDGPTHQPIEQLASLRSMPNVHIWRPADATETAIAWLEALKRTSGPTALVLSRQNLPILDRSRCAPQHEASRGGYVLLDPRRGAHPKAVVLASGSEVHVALAAYELLEEIGIPVRVVSMPCWEQFEAQPKAYREHVLPPQLWTRLAIEAGVSFGWHRWVGPCGVILGIDRYGASAPGSENLARYGMTAEAVVAGVRELLTPV